MFLKMIDDLYVGAFYFMLVRAVVLVAETVYLLLKKGRNSDVLPNLVLGASVYFGMKLLQNGLMLASMIWISQYALWSFDFSWWLLALTILGADLSFYIYHYTAHRVRLFWADHSVHHSSGEFNFTTNLRHSFFSGLYSWWPSAVLLLLGVPPLLLVWCRALVNDYTFFLHTQYVGKLGGLERVLNTPSHHRVHHSMNPEYVDKNFGFMFIFWDKLFGTYAEEATQCRFGVANGPNSRNPLAIATHEWRAMLRDVLRSKGWRSKCRVLW